jgi:hypothetical protein
VIEAQGTGAQTTQRIEAFATGLSVVKTGLNTTSADINSFAWVEAIQNARDRGLTITLSAPYPDGLEPVPN